ncbi:hypothetical protein ACFQS7_04515 [Dankookia sp. GCM10030260]|uniref:hypothetical protein n=1 Tax=Dankookia sp. GCM10030260 TaxID=3273390 RepID=UPI003607DB25
MPIPKARAAVIAGCLTLLAAPAWAQSAANTDTSPAATPAPAAVPDAAPPAIRPREAGAVVPMPVWLDRNGDPVETHQNTLADPDRMDAGKPFTPLPWGSIVGHVPGMNAGPAFRPLPPGVVVNSRPAMMAGKPFTSLPEGAQPGAVPGMQAGPGQGPLSPPGG